MSKGQIGYLHVPDMGANGIREFINMKKLKDRPTALPGRPDAPVKRQP